MYFWSHLNIYNRKVLKAEGDKVQRNDIVNQMEIIELLLYYMEMFTCMFSILLNTYVGREKVSDVKTK